MLPRGVLEKGAIWVRVVIYSLGQVLSGTLANCSLASPEEWASLFVNRRVGVG